MVMGTRDEEWPVMPPKLFTLERLWALERDQEPGTVGEDDFAMLLDHARCFVRMMQPGVLEKIAQDQGIPWGPPPKPRESSIWTGPEENVDHQVVGHESMGYELVSASPAIRHNGPMLITLHFRKP